MEGRWVFSLIVASLLVEVKLDATANTTVPDATEPPAPLVPSDINVLKQTGVCRFCTCNDTTFEIDCADRGLKFFSKEEWAYIAALKPTHLDFSENSITNVTALAELPLQLLNLSRCDVEFIEFGSFKELRNLSVLDLSHNKLTSDKLSPHAFEGRYSPEEYQPLAALRTLSLAYNQLHSLHQDLFEHLPELTELDLSGNPLTTIDHVTVIAVSSLPMLEVLRLRSCQLTDIPDKFLHTPRHLQRLDLSDNQLTAVPQELAETKNLVYLNLNQNPIQELDMDSEDYKGFPRLRKLEELHMCNMGSLTRIGQGALAGLEAVTRLHISFNPRLREIHPKALARPDDIGENYVWPLVKELYLQSNNLSELDSRLVSRWDLLQKIEISDNPLLCDCSTQWMVDMLVPLVERRRENASEKMVCQEPIEMRGLTMKHLSETHRTMRCVDKYGHRPERDGAILLGTLIGVLLAVPIVLGLMLLWRRGYFAFLGLRGPVDVSRAFYKRAPDDDSYM